MKPAPGYSYRPGEVHDVPVKHAEILKEMGKARDPKSTLPKEFPSRDELIRAGYETVEMIEAADDLKKVPGIGPAGEKEIIKYLKDNS